MKFFKSIFLSLVVVFALFNAYSQGSFEIHVGTGIPLSDMSRGGIGLGEGDTEYGSAIAGITMGLKYNYQVTPNGLGVFAGLDFIYNGINKAYKDDMETYFSLFGITEYEFHSFYNIPLSLGGFYKYSANENIAFYGNAGATLNFFKSSDLVIGNSTFQADWSNNIGFMIGAGVTYKERVSFQVNYLGLGKHDYTVVNTSTPEYPSDGEEEINMLTLTIGFNF